MPTYVIDTQSTGLTFSPLIGSANNSFSFARKIFKEHFEGDDNFRDVYVANIAMLLYDRYGITDYKDRNQAAYDIMDVIFDAREFKTEEIDTNDMIKNRWEILDIRG